MTEALLKPASDAPNGALGEQVSLAELFLQASRELSYSDARLYRSVDRHLSRTREILRQAETEPSNDESQHQPTPVQHLIGTPSFERQTRKSLEILCKQHGIRGYSRMCKAIMIQRLKDAGVTEPSVPMEALSKSELLILLQDVLSPPAHDG